VHTKQPEEAFPVFERLSSLLPQPAWPKYGLAVVLVGAKHDAEAIWVLAPLIDAGSADPVVLSLASGAYEARGNIPKAVALLREAIILDPANANCYVVFTALCLNHSSFCVGIDMIDVGLQSIHNDHSLYPVARAALCANLGVR
jgi:predicted Zn-dependent protease